MSKKEYLWKLSDLKNIQKNNYRVFLCFACGGGSSMGYKLAGYDVIGDCEIDPKINKMYLANFSPKYNFSMNGERSKNWGKLKKFREGQADQILDDLFFYFIQLAKRLQPKVVVAENVEGLLRGNAKGYVNLIIKKFHDAGYKVQLFLLNAATMGVPQCRKRSFFICTRKDLDLPNIKLNFHEKPITYGEFKDNHYKPMNKNTLFYKRWLKRIPKDRNIGDTVKRTENGKISMFSFTFCKDSEVPNTLTASNNPVRFDVPGFISDKDMITIQTFPQDYDFNDMSANYVCGMSVPPIMMERIARQIKIQLLDKVR
ncbi:MAG TPA: DNA cytosine methyltransferase [Candidatus Companilactobacillus pullicola]|uniref:DNA (cytosine-5-)-methyltransferase n=1 Tax=Candidatus Companilactobacillus pullicola TaxID=2838523 RepID=A0A9D1ZMV5_9LACO|nr:DNA cytosine methyltransferase [Candidatus Companilactobacillus pullicola]